MGMLWDHESCSHDGFWGQQPITTRKIPCRVYTTSPTSPLNWMKPDSASVTVQMGLIYLSLLLYCNLDSFQTSIYDYCFHTESFCVRRQCFCFGVSWFGVIPCMCQLTILHGKFCFILILIVMFEGCSGGNLDLDCGSINVFSS